MLYKNFIYHSPNLVPLPNHRESELQQKDESLCQHLAHLGKPSAHSPALLSFLAGEITDQPDELWTEVCDIVQETGIETIPMEKICRKAKWLSEEALQIAVKRREVKSKGEKERYSHVNAEFQRIARRDKKAFLGDQCKEIEEKTEWERLEISSRKLEISREHFRQRWVR